MVTNTREPVTTRPKNGVGFDGVTIRGKGSRGSRGGGGGNNPGDDFGGGSHRHDAGSGWADERYRIGIWVGLASIVMMFTALSSAYIVRSGLPASIDWSLTKLPSLVWLSTAIIIASSFVVQSARRRLHADDAPASRRLLFVSLALGLGFLASQLGAWAQLAGQGVYLASNPHSSFFYVLTALHGLHVAGGIFGLCYLLFRLWGRQTGDERQTGSRRRRRITDAVAIYWHFMDGLWIYLVLLLFIWR